MEYRYLGHTGLKVSELCMGAMTFGQETSEADSFAMLDRFAEAGGNFIDTANIYSHGISEEIVGRWLAGKNRHDYVIATKVRFAMGDGPNDVGLSRKHIVAAVEDSLKRLGTDYIDLYQAHCWDPGTPLKETLSTFDDLVEQGKARYVGASNYSGWQLQKSVDLCRYNGWERFRCLQPLYNLLDRTIEWEIVPVCLNEGLGIIPWSPLRGGWLTGKYHRDMEDPPEGTRLDDAYKKGWGERWRAYGTEQTWAILDELADVASETGKEIAQVALRWLLQRPGVTAPIIGARTLTQFESNMGAVGWTLSDEQMDRLNRVSDPGSPYPTYFIENAREDR
jgi:aryl-alcohol dehydrogenase-like predicted oxidoreductase